MSDTRSLYSVNVPAFYFFSKSFEKSFWSIFFLYSFISCASIRFNSMRVRVLTAKFVAINPDDDLFVFFGFILIVFQSSSRCESEQSIFRCRSTK